MKIMMHNKTIDRYFMFNKEYRIENATSKDIKDIFELSNDNVVRKNSINQDKIIWENHVK